MVRDTNRLQINNEFFLYRYRNGVRLISPEVVNEQTISSQLFHTGYTVEQAFQLPFSVTILNRAAAVQHINEQSAETAGYLSTADAIGKSIKDTATPESAQRVMRNNMEVIKQSKKKLCEEHVLRKDEISYHSLAVKSPLYDEHDNVIGLMGIGIIIGKNPLVESLTQITQLGLLNLNDFSHEILPGKKIHYACLSKRECEILRLLIRGKSAKRIAEILFISTRTVEQHIVNMRIKLAVSSKAELIEKVMDEYF